MSGWNSVVFVKGNGEKADAKAVAQWPGVDAMWSTSGKWDWCIKLKNDHSSPEQTEQFVSKLHQANWIAQTESNWWRQL